MPLTIGTILGHYEIRSLIGQGGMGEVYRALDTTLKRDVALKVLPAAFLLDSERMSRFQREAEVLASLDHPNIGPIHGIVDDAGSRALVLALIEGPTLADRIDAGPLPLDEAIAAAKQIVDALEYAHDRNIIHRDLKPANIKISPDGTIKVLDFGLAKVLEAEPPATSLANSPTLTFGRTTAGVIMGTAAYMSPEQAVGRPVDRRSDIFSFGAVLYEMLTAKQVFTGETAPDILEAVVKTNPDWSKLPAATPAHIRQLLHRCLAKDRKLRIQAIGEARIALAHPPAEPPPAPPAKTNKLIIAAAILTTLAAGWAIGHFRNSQPEPQTVKLFLPPPDKTSFFESVISPDGQHIAFTVYSGQRNLLWVRDLNGLNARELSGTEGTYHQPFWSPDSRFIAFFADGKLRKVAVSGGPVKTLCAAETPRGGSWGASGTIVFSPYFGFRGLYRCPADGGEATPVTSAADGISQRYPFFLPDGRTYLYVVRTPDVEKNHIALGTLDSKAQRPILNVNSNAIYASGHLLFLRGTSLVAQAFDPNSATTSGEEIPVAEAVNFDSLNVFGTFSASSNGVLTCQSGRENFTSQFTWLDRSGKVLGSLSPSGLVRRPAIAPSGDAVAYERENPATGIRETWLFDLKRNTDSRFAFHPEYGSFNPMWSGDGAQILFSSVRPGRGFLYRKPAAGTSQEESLPGTESGNGTRGTDISRDGRFIVGQIQGSKTREDLWIFPQFGDRKLKPYLQSPASERNARISPDGQRLAYVSDENQRDEVYVQSFPVPAAKLQISANGGTLPVWSRDGRELYFISPDKKMMAVDGKTNSTPKALFSVPEIAAFDVSKDGRFLIPIVVDQSAHPPLTVFLNWQFSLKK